MKERVFPSGGVTRAQTLLSMLGSFWSMFFSGRDLVQGYLQARSKAELQTFLDLIEYIRCASRFDVPIYHRKNWQLLTLKKSSKLGSGPADFGEGYLTGPQADGSNIYYAGNLYNYVRYPIPDDLREAPAIFNRLTEPSISWSNDIDYQLTVEDGTISFLRDPFDYPDLIPQRALFDATGTQTDTEIGLWIFRGNFDWDAIYKQWAYAIELIMDSGEGYRDLMNAVLDAVTGGTSLQQIERAMMAMTGVPVVLEAQETVELIEKDASYLTIATDKNVYKFDPSAEAVVTVGQVLLAGTSLVDAFEVVDISRGSIPSTVNVLTLGHDMLAPGFVGDLSFQNKDVPLVVSTVDGITKVEFELGGLEEDVTRFWNYVHTRGVLAGKTLAQCLDLRENPSGEPTAASLPATINPLKFLVENVLRYNTLFIHSKATAFGPGAVGLEHAKILRKVLSPHHIVLILVSLTATDESIDPTATPDLVSVSGISETVGLSYEPEVVTDSVDESLFAETASLAQIT